MRGFFTGSGGDESRSIWKECWIFGSTSYDQRLL